jgi:hypothetical protein
MHPVPLQTGQKWHLKGVDAETVYVDKTDPYSFCLITAESGLVYQKKTS